ncbi:MAG: GNAT family N-acetyltransferase [Planctomycetota bacterium]
MKREVNFLERIWESMSHGEQDAELRTDDATEAEGKDGTSIRLRPYKRRDRRAVLGIAGRNFDGVSLDQNVERRFGEVGESWRVHKKKAVDYDLRNNASHAFVAIVDGQISGFICTRLHRDRSLGHITNLAVERELRSRGVGTALINKALDHFKREGLEFARIETLKQNTKGRGLYPKLGFEKVGQQVFYFQKLGKKSVASAE